MSNILDIKNILDTSSIDKWEEEFKDIHVINKELIKHAFSQAENGNNEILRRIHQRFGAHDMRYIAVIRAKKAIHNRNSMLISMLYYELNEFYGEIIDKEFILACQTDNFDIFLFLQNLLNIKLVDFHFSFAVFNTSNDHKIAKWILQRGIGLKFIHNKSSYYSAENVKFACDNNVINDSTIPIFFEHFSDDAIIYLLGLKKNLVLSLIHEKLNRPSNCPYTYCKFVNFLIKFKIANPSAIRHTVNNYLEKSSVAKLYWWDGKRVCIY